MDDPAGSLPPESQRVEYKEALDPTEAKDRLTLVKEIVAFANSNGGRIVVGVTNSGVPVGVPAAQMVGWDPSKIGDLLDSFIDPDHLEVAISFSMEEALGGQVLVTIDVPQFESPPLVLSKDGNHGDGHSAFSRYSVFVRHNTKAEPARRSDYLKWRDDLRNRILQQFQMVIQAPETAHLRMIGDEEVRDEPNFLLSRAVDLFRQRPEKLLDGDDLLYLFQNRDAIDFSADLVPELLIHSALRRRATLFFWLALSGIDANSVSRILHAALRMSDRDKSDMASALPLVASLYLGATDYAELVGLMATSSYAHISDAAKKCPTITEALAAVEERRNGAVDQIPLADFGDDQLLRAAEDLAAEQNAGRISRRMPNLGLEYLARYLTLKPALQRAARRDR